MARTYAANHIAQIKLGSNTTAHIIDPDWLGGRSADEYALKTEVTAAQSKVFKYQGSIDNATQFETYIIGCKQADGATACVIGDVYIVSHAFSFTPSGGTEIKCEPGDLWIYNAEDDEVEGEYQYWDVVQGNINLDSLDEIYAAIGHNHDDTYSKLGHTHSVTSNVSVASVSENKSSITDNGHEHTVTDVSADYTPAGTVEITAGTSTDGYKIQPTIPDEGHTHPVTVSGSYTPAGGVTISGAPGGSITYGNADASSKLSHIHTVGVGFGDYTPEGSLSEAETHTHGLTGGGVSLTADANTTDGILILNVTHTNPTVVANGAHTHNFTGTKSTQFNTKSFDTSKFNAPALGYSGTKGDLSATFAGSAATITLAGTANINTTKLSTTEPVYIKATFNGTPGKATQTGLKTDKKPTGISLGNHTHTVTLNNSAVTTGGPNK